MGRSSNHHKDSLELEKSHHHYSNSTFDFEVLKEKIDTFYHNLERQQGSHDRSLLSRQSANNPSVYITSMSKENYRTEVEKSRISFGLVRKQVAKMVDLYSNQIVQTGLVEE